VAAAAVAAAAAAAVVVVVVAAAVVVVADLEGARVGESRAEAADQDPEVVARAEEARVVLAAVMDRSDRDLPSTRLVRTSSSRISPGRPAARPAGPSRWTTVWPTSGWRPRWRRSSSRLG
jgi:hypothetical protein